MWLMPNICFISGSLEFWYMLGRGCLPDRPHVKTLGTESNASRVDISPVLSQSTIGGVKHILCDSSGKGGLEACTCFPAAFSPCTFSLSSFYFGIFFLQYSFWLWVWHVWPVSPWANQQTWQSLGHPSTKMISGFMHFRVKNIFKDFYENPRKHSPILFCKGSCHIYIFFYPKSY